MAKISVDSLLGNNGPTYPEAVVAPYRQELAEAGFTQLLTPEAVDAALDRNDDTVTLVVLNSVCGCSARVCRPGTLLSLFNDKIPDQIVTIFAGMEKEAVAHFRDKFLPGQTPSSPNIAVFKNGELINILQRYQIEGGSAGNIADALTAVYNEHCTLANSEEKVVALRKLFIEKYQVDPLSATA
jgi:putative YphP/YqiW family bacilliredoxin